MNKLILHIPHSSLVLPQDFWNNVICNKNIINVFNYKITDLYTNELFNYKNYTSIVAPYSRVYCDIEKFVCDNQEIMAKFGMGFVYTNTNEGCEFLKATQSYKQNIYNNYYKKWHLVLDNIVDCSIKKINTILLDCHSFGKETIMFKNKKKNLPDICIGYNKFYNNKKLIKFIKDYFKACGYKVKFNYPYSGAMVPDLFLTNRVNNLNCVMIEINKNLYLNNDYSKNQNFNKLQGQINKLLSLLEKLKI